VSSIGGINGAGGGWSNAGGIREIMALRQQIIERSQILQQVHAPAGTAATAAPAAAPATPAGGFAQALTSALDGVNSSQQRAEDVSAAYEKGEVTDIAKVMLARQEAGVGFEATLQVRNKLLNAYQEIMRMGV
jgi:flagellar hook-basal body complex protein FliE